MTGKYYIFGEWKKFKSPLTVPDVEKICGRADEIRRKTAGYPPDRVLRLLGNMRRKWLDPRYAVRKKVKSLLPRETGFSPEMTELGIRELCNMLDPEMLRRKMDAELRGVHGTGGYRYDPGTKTALRWHPLGTVLHVLSGNVFMVAAGSLIEGLITGNVNILKMSSSERVFLPRLIESLIECDKDGVVSGSLAVVEYSSAQQDVISQFKKSVDGIVVWGGEEAVRAYRENLRAGTRLIEFGPKLSLAIITEKGFSLHKPADAALKLARDISIWDQNACTAPQVCYVEGARNAGLLAEELAGAFKKVSKTMPPGRIDLHSAVDIRKLRTVFEIAQARGEGLLKCSSGDLDWTVIVDKDQKMEPSPLHRTIRIIPFKSLSEPIRQVSELRGYVQTAGIMASGRENWELSARLGMEGVLRIVELGQMAAGEAGDPHDGKYDLPQLMNLVLTRFPMPADDMEPADFLPPGEKNALIDERLRLLIDKAKNSKFYRERIGSLKIDSVRDLARIPVLTSDEMEANIPPNGTGLAAGPYTGGYVSRSGGSTGKPKFSIYDRHDWEEMISNAVRVLKSAGLSKGDRLANCMLAGDLYGSFVSFDHINYRAGAATFAFANDAKPEVFLDMWKKFRINVVQGIPTLLLPLLKKIKEMEPSFSIEKVIYAGSPMSRQGYDWIKSALGASRISSIIGANDGGQIAYQCGEMSGAVHHLIDDFNYVEITDENGRPVPDGTPGRILITSLLKYAFPLIRYDIGDMGRIIPGVCRCARTARMLEYLGRSGDMLTVGVLNLRYRDFLNALKGLPVSEMQVIARNSDKGEYLVVKIESEDLSGTFRRRIGQAFLDRVKLLKDRLDKGTLEKLDIQLSKPGSLPRNPRSGKIKNLVDERT